MKIYSIRWTRAVKNRFLIRRILPCGMFDRKINVKMKILVRFLNLIRSENYEGSDTMLNLVTKSSVKQWYSRREIL